MESAPFFRYNPVIDSGRNRQTAKLSILHSAGACPPYCRVGRAGSRGRGQTAGGKGREPRHVERTKRICPLRRPAAVKWQAIPAYINTLADCLGRVGRGTACVGNGARHSPGGRMVPGFRSGRSAIPPEGGAFAGSRRNRMAVQAGPINYFAILPLSKCRRSPRTLHFPGEWGPRSDRCANA